MGLNIGDSSNRVNKRVKVAGGRGPSHAPKRKRVEGDRVRVTIDSTKSGIHEAAGTFAAGFVLREDTDRVPFFFADGMPTDMGVMALALARFVWQVCSHTEHVAPGFTADVMDTCADFAKAAKEGRDPLDVSKWQ